MKTLKYGLAVALLGTAGHAFAQYQPDALRFSQSQPVGTARTLGIGGASVAVGGDFGGVSVNPAGLGMFQRSEFSFSPGFSLLSSDASAFGSTSNNSRSNLNVASAGLVLARRRPDGDGSAWRAGSFGLGITRTASYNQLFRYSGRPEFNQDIFQRLSQDQNAGLDDLAFDTYLTERDAMVRSFRQTSFSLAGSTRTKRFVPVAPLRSSIWPTEPATSISFMSGPESALRACATTPRIF
ncbi:hypothetical protein D0N36_05555 [Hymenobacter lapidiphilus]|uniref:hypothetical protein n=1 Tax=Hymenobacter sp. CCM 8763 TaxID=2303334 RepID=UPI000E355085|nr:hypothetical protein [Hymenobacter sp. CCM 8763]RFP66182.1 hypothetical protein D0N36_05555 [Hymenobacter sp. CCM 8763]